MVWKKNTFFILSRVYHTHIAVSLKRKQKQSNKTGRSHGWIWLEYSFQPSCSWNEGRKTQGKKRSDSVKRLTTVMLGNAIRFENIWSQNKVIQIMFAELCWAQWAHEAAHLSMRGEDTEKPYGLGLPLWPQYNKRRTALVPRPSQIFSLSLSLCPQSIQ